MKYLKILVLAAVVAASLTALFGAAAASATVLCSETKTPCPAAQKWPVKTVFDFELKAKTVATLTNTSGGVLGSCQAGTVKGELSKAGGAAETVVATVAKGDLTLTACNAAVKTEAGGTLEVHQISGTDNGTVTGSGFEIKLSIGLVDCYYQTGNGADLGALIGGKNPMLAINVVLTSNGEKSDVECPATVKWTAEYTLKEPDPGGVVTPLFVEPE